MCKILLKVFKLALLCVPISLVMTALNLSSRKFASFQAMFFCFKRLNNTGKTQIAPS